MVVFICEAEGIRLPLVRPFVGAKGNRLMESRSGVNFAVVGATALDSSFHAARGVDNPLTNSSLRVQLSWFKQSLQSICLNVEGNKLNQTNMHLIKYAQN